MSTTTGNDESLDEKEGMIYEARNFLREAGIRISEEAERSDRLSDFGKRLQVDMARRMMEASKFLAGENVKNPNRAIATIKGEILDQGRRSFDTNFSEKRKNMHANQARNLEVALEAKGVSLESLLPEEEG